MNRSEALVSLSRDHHVALVHALRLRRASDADLEKTVARFLAFLAGDGRKHFAAEEAVLLPELTGATEALGERVRTEHARINAAAAELGDRPAVPAAHALGQMLADHVRFEEREVFPALEELPDAVLVDVARRLEWYVPRGSLGNRGS